MTRFKMFIKYKDSARFPVGVVVAAFVVLLSIPAAAVAEAASRILPVPVSSFLPGGRASSIAQELFMHNKCTGLNLGDEITRNCLKLVLHPAAAPHERSNIVTTGNIFASQCDFTSCFRFSAAFSAFACSFLCRSSKFFCFASSVFVYSLALREVKRFKAMSLLQYH